MAYLDKAGLTHFWDAIKTKLSNKADLVDGKVPASQLPDNSGGGDCISEVIHCYIDLMTMSASDVSHTYQEICEMEQANKVVIIKCDVNGLNQVYGTLTSVNYGLELVFFNVIAQYDLLGNGLQLFYFTLEMSPNGGTFLKPYLVNTTSVFG